MGHRARAWRDLGQGQMRTGLGCVKIEQFVRVSRLLVWDQPPFVPKCGVSNAAHWMVQHIHAFPKLVEMDLAGILRFLCPGYQFTSPFRVPYEYSQTPNAPHKKHEPYRCTGDAIRCGGCLILILAGRSAEEPNTPVCVGFRLRTKCVGA